MAKTQDPAPVTPYVVFHVEVTSKRGSAYSDGAARDLLKASRAQLQAANVISTYSKSYATLSGGVPTNPIIILDIPRETDPKKTQTNPSAFFASDDKVTIIWREVTPETTPPLPEGVSDLGKALGGPTTVASDLAEGGVIDAETAKNIGEGFKNAAG